MINLYVRKSNNVSFGTAENPFQIVEEKICDGSPAVCESLPDYITFGDNWAGQDGVQFGVGFGQCNNGSLTYDGRCSGKIIKYDAFEIGIDYQVNFKVNILINRNGTVQARCGGSSLNAYDNGSYEFSFTATSTDLTFNSGWNETSIYDIEIVATTPGYQPELLEFVDSFTELDIHQTTDVVFNKSLKDIRSPEKISGEYTKPFKLPITEINQRFFGGLNSHDGVSSFQIGQKLESVLVIDGINHVEGFLQLEKITEYNEIKFFSVIFYSDISLFQKFANLKLTDLDTTDNPINYTAQNIYNFATNDNIVDGRTALHHGWNHIFALLERGENHQYHAGKRPLTQNPYDYSIDPNNRRYGMMEDSYIPGLLNDYIFKKIHEEQGYTVEGTMIDSIVDSQTWRNLVVPLNRAIPQDSGMEPADHLMDIAGTKSVSKTIRADELVQEGDDVFIMRFASSDNDTHFIGNDGATHFIPHNPVRANVKLNLNVLCDAQKHPDNNNPDGFSTRIRFSLHPIQTYGVNGENQKDLGMYFDDGDSNFLDTQVLGQHVDIYNPGPDNEYSYEFNIGKMLFYAKEYYGNDYDKYPYFELRMYYSEPKFQDGVTAYEVCNNTAMNTYNTAVNLACSNFLDSQAISGAPAGTSCYDCCMNHAGQDDLKALFGYTPYCVQLVYDQTYQYCDSGCADTALGIYQTAISDAQSILESDQNTCVISYGTEPSDKMIYNFDFNYELKTDLSTTDILLPFGKIIDNPIKHVSGNLSQMDYIKNLITMFNLYVTVDNINKIVKYEKWDDFYVDDLDDLSDKIILDKKIDRKFINDIVPRFLEYQMETIDFDKNTINYTDSFGVNPTLYSHDSGNEYESKKTTTTLKNKFLFNENINLANEPTDYQIATVKDDNYENKRVDDWGLSMLFFRKEYGDGLNNSFYSSLKLNSYALDNTVYEFYHDDICLYRNDEVIYGNSVSLINSFNVPERFYTSVTYPYYRTWITEYWGEFFKIVNSQESYLLNASFYISAQDYFNIKMNNRIKIGNEIYYINKIKDWNPDTPTTIELIKFIYNDTVDVVVINDTTGNDVVLNPKDSNLNTNFATTLETNNVIKSSTDVNIVSGDNNVVLESSTISLSGNNNTITNIDTGNISGDFIDVSNSSNIIIKNSSNITMTNSNGITVDGETDVNYINNIKYTDSSIGNSENVINSGGHDTIQDDFTDAGIIDPLADHVYWPTAIETYKLEDAGANKV